MTDFSIDTTQVGVPIDTRWRASSHGQDAARPGTLDLSKFTSGTHFNIGGRTDSVIPSGVALTYNGTSKMYEPWVASSDPGTTPHPTVAGFINDDSGVAIYRRAGVAASTKAAFALLVHGVVETSYLPVAAQRAAISAAPTTGAFVYA
ncbi:hypothetical protein ACSHWG_00870 [Leucobacter sp. Z1108]|uniref:hypothetical protein n=1 Tax=Leucobacter sp. Z1108 TaxID=3439066 RepID=UPI003F2D17AD